MKIKDFLTENNWIKCKAEYINKKGTCIWGAVTKCYEIEEQLRVEKTILEKINGKSLCSIFHWNDATERTFSDVKQLVEELDI